MSLLLACILPFSYQRYVFRFSASVFEVYENEIATLRSTVSDLEKGSAVHEAPCASAKGNLVQHSKENRDRRDGERDGKKPSLQNSINLMDLASGNHSNISAVYHERYRKHQKQRITWRKQLATMSKSVSRLREENNELRRVTRKSALHKK